MPAAMAGLGGHCGHSLIADGAIRKSISNVGFRKK
jgi:hypothetical protein